MPASMKAWTEPGMCRWCGLGIITKGQRDKRRTWHPECVKIYRIACFSNDQRAAVWERDRGLCARCGTQTIKNVLIRGFGNTADRAVDLAKVPYHYLPPTGHLWQVDHIRPLLDANGDMEFYLLANLQTLCTKCHVAKGVEDNRRRKTASDNQLLLNA